MIRVWWVMFLFFFAISPLVSLWFLTSNTKKCGCKKLPWNKHESILSVLMSKKNFQITICDALSTANLASQTVIWKQLTKSHVSVLMSKNFQITIWDLIYSQSVFEDFLIHHYRLSLEGARDELKCRAFLIHHYRLSGDEARNEFGRHSNVFLTLSFFINADCL